MSALLFCALLFGSGAAAQAQAIGFPGKDKMPGSFADLVDLVSPATVNIIAIENGVGAEGGSEGQGSGFLISPDGQVVTNYHVIKGADELSIVFGTGQKYPATIIGTDEETDIALLKIKANRAFPYVEFRAGKDIRVGDWVLAVGNPFGIGQSSSVGIVSAIGRDAEGSGPYVDYLQTDAVINRGNSGGPLFDMAGKVVAINSAIYSPTGASVGIGYAIPRSVAQSIVAEIQLNGKVRRGFLGAQLRTAEMTFENDSAHFQAAATVEGLVPGGPAELAGMQVEDVILNVDGAAVKDSAEVLRILAGLRATQKVRFDVLRGSETLPLTVTLKDRPAKTEVDSLLGVASPNPSGAQNPTAPSSDTGLGLVDLSSSFRDSIGMRRDQAGVYVDTVAPGTPAARKGLRSGMVILEFDQSGVASVAQWDNQIAKARRAGKTEVLLKVRLTNGSENFVVLPL